MGRWYEERRRRDEGKKIEKENGRRKERDKRAWVRRKEGEKGRREEGIPLPNMGGRETSRPNES